MKNYTLTHNETSFGILYLNAKNAINVNVRVGISSSFKIVENRNGLSINTINDLIEQYNKSNLA